MADMVYLECCKGVSHSKTVDFVSFLLHFLELYKEASIRLYQYGLPLLADAIIGSWC